MHVVDNTPWGEVRVIYNNIINADYLSKRNKRVFEDLSTFIMQHEFQLQSSYHRHHL